MGGGRSRDVQVDQDMWRIRSGCSVVGTHVKHGTMHREGTALSRWMLEDRRAGVHSWIPIPSRLRRFYRKIDGM